jgi:hypothetical protein
VTVSEEGATVGGYKTSVRAADLLSIGLGGDSHITLNREKAIAIGPERVMPLAHLASQHPSVTQRLKNLTHRAWGQATPAWLEYWYLLREPSEGLLQTAQERALVECLRDGPKPLPEIIKRLGVLHVAQIGTGELLRQEIVGKAGLTPTDLMHIEGTYAVWDAEASAAALDVFAHYQFQQPDEIRQRVWQLAAEMIVHIVVTFLSRKSLPAPEGRLPDGARDSKHTHRDDDIGRWFFYNSLYGLNPHLETQFRLRQPVIGIGAPAALFLRDVAQALHTDLILPEHYQVANALGAVAGVNMVAEEISVYPRLSASGLEVLGYYVQTGDGRRDFEEDELSDALTYARNLAQERVLGAALRSGADNPQVTVEQTTDGLDAYRIRAKAMGNPRLS